MPKTVVLVRDKPIACLVPKGSTSVGSRWECDIQLLGVNSTEWAASEERGAQEAWDARKAWDEPGESTRLGTCASPCTVTTDLARLPSADAVVWNLFSGRGSPEQLEKRPGALWVMSDYYEALPKAEASMASLLEVAPHLPRLLGQTDLVMSYQPGAQIWRPWFRSEELSAPRSEAAAVATDREILALVVADHLAEGAEAEQSGRSPYLRRLEADLADLTRGDARFAGRTVFGGYGSGYGRRITPAEFGDLRGKAKFYLAFENSLCDGYVTEKPLHALHEGQDGFAGLASAQGGVPVVHGGRSRTDYERMLPPGSFIHTDDFASPRALAEHLLELDKDDEKYLKFFAWRATHRVVGHEEVGEEALCAVCEAAHGVRAERATSSFLAAWRDAGEHCRRPPWAP